VELIEVHTSYNPNTHIKLKEKNRSDLSREPGKVLQPRKEKKWNNKIKENMRT
jgi:hypothetical protein